MLLFKTKTVASPDGCTNAKHHKNNGQNLDLLLAVMTDRLQHPHQQSTNCLWNGAWEVQPSLHRIILDVLRLLWRHDILKPPPIPRNVTSFMDDLLTALASQIWFHIASTG